MKFLSLILAYATTALRHLRGVSFDVGCLTVNDSDSRNCTSYFTSNQERGGRYFGSPHANSNARLLEHSSQSSTCSDSWFCSWYEYSCWSSWVQTQCPEICGLCSPLRNQLDDTLRELQFTSPGAFGLVRDYHPEFYFDDNSCYPDYAITRQAQPNRGIEDYSLTHACRSEEFMSRANTYHRWSTKVAAGRTYQVHLFDLYFQKDRVPHVWGFAGHKHDVETVIMYFTEGRPTHVAVSAHGSYENTKRWSDVPGTPHPQIVYQSAYWNTHSFRFAHRWEFSAPGVLPPVASWELMTGDPGYTTLVLQNAINGLYAHSGYSLKVSDNNFLSQVNNPFKPEGYPQFTS